MKRNTLFALLAVGATGLVALTGCGKKKAGGTSVIQVKMYEGGNGRAWFDKIARKFEAAEKAKGNDVSVVLENKDYSKIVGEDFVSLMEIPNENNYDLFLLDGPDINQIISESYEILGTDSQALLEDLTPIFESKAIGFDGNEETETIKSRFFNGYEEALKYHHSVPSLQDKWDGKMFALPWLDAQTGIVCNVNILKNNGIDIPLTSDQFVESVKAVNKVQGVNAFCYSGQDAPFYWAYLTETWFAQYEGYEEFNNYIKCDPVGDDNPDDIKNKGYEVFGKKGYAESLRPLLEVLKNEYLVSGSNGHTYAQAQKNFADGRAAFMVNGDWMVKEMESYVSPASFENLMNCEMLKTPVLSCMGPEVGLSTDDELAQLVSMIDDLKSNEEIKVALPALNDAGIERIRNARTVHYGEGANHLMCVPSYADAKDNALKFIRYIYSNDGCNLFNEDSYCNFPLHYNLNKAESDLSVYQRSLNKIASYPTVNMVDSVAELNEIRSTTGIRLFNAYLDGGVSVFKAYLTGNKTDSADYIANLEYNAAKLNWETWMGNFVW